MTKHLLVIKGDPPSQGFEREQDPFLKELVQVGASEVKY